MKETIRALTKRLEQCKTREDQPCCLFQLTEDDKKETRISANSLLRNKEISIENCKTPSELSEAIVDLAQENKRKFEEYKLKVASHLKAFKEETAQKLSQLVGFVEGVVMDLITFKGEKYSRILDKIDSENFEVELELVLKEISTKEESKKTERKMKEFLHDLKHEMEAASKEISQVISRKHKSLERGLERILNDQNQKLKIDTRALSELKELKSNVSICHGTFGLAFSPLNPEKVSCIYEDGTLGVLHVIQEKLLRKTKCDATGKSINKSVLFSPNGKLFLTNSFSSCEICFFRAQDTKKIQCLDARKGGKQIVTLKWLNNLEVIAAFRKPGIIQVFKVDSKRTLLTLRPDLTQGNGFICAFDLCASGSAVICGGLEEVNGRKNSVLFKMSMVDEQLRPEWIQRRHTNLIREVKTTKSRNYVISVGNDKSIIFTNERDGTTIKRGAALCNDNIIGLILSQDEEFIMVHSYSSVVVLKWGKNEEKLVELTQKVSVSENHEKDMNGFNISWETMWGNLFLFALKDGSVLKGVIRY